MRIACVHIPQFALQCATRIDPSLRGRPADGEAGVALVVVGPPPTLAAADSRSVLHAPVKAAAPVVLACSRAAWSLGARVGMTATAARSLSPHIEVVTADPQLERDTVRAIADVLLALSPVVDVGGRVGPGGAHLALYCEVPAKTRGTSYGDRLLERLESLGLTGRIGIADDRFTAWVAAWLGAWDAHDRAASGAASPVRHDETGVVSVPRGGSAAFLAPRPLSLLSISPEVQHMLEALGVRTLGEFASLPAPTVSSRGARIEADYQALARGESGNVLRPYAPDAPIREEAVIRHVPPVASTALSSHEHAGHGVHAPGLSVPAAVALLAERVAMRLAGRARCAARLDITIGGESGEHVVTVSSVREGHGLLSSGPELADAIGAALGDSTGQAWQLRVIVSGEALAGDAPDTTDAFVAEPLTQRTFALAIATPTVPANTASSVFASSTSAPSVFASTAASAAAEPASARSHRRGPSAGPDTSSPDGASTPSNEPATARPSAAMSDADVALSIALSTTGGAVDRVFGLTSPVSSTLVSERRDSHRRTRRGKQRRRAEVASMVQPRLFKM